MSYGIKGRENMLQGRTLCTVSMVIEIKVVIG